MTAMHAAVAVVLINLFFVLVLCVGAALTGGGS